MYDMHTILHPINYFDSFNNLLLFGRACELPGTEKQRKR